MDSSQTDSRPIRSRWKWGLLALLMVILALLVRGYFVSGWQRTIRIEGVSMAPHLLGVHCRERCPDCNFQFACEPVSAGSELYCPNCGFEFSATGKAVAGQTVYVDRWPVYWNQLRRFDVVALELPGEDRDWGVKRIVGLPGESVQVARGDLFVNGEIVRKNLTQLEKVALLVHDDAYRGEHPRWISRTEENGWLSKPSGYSFTKSENNEQTGWLDYIHGRTFPSLLLPNEIEPRNDLPFNQSHTGPLHVVTDIFFQCRFRLSLGAKLEAQLNLHETLWQMEITCQGGIAVTRGGKEILRESKPIPPNEFTELTWGYADGKLILRVADLEYTSEALYISEKVNPSSRPFAIGASGGTVQIENLRIFRDLYYLGPGGSDRWSAQLGAHAYLLLGDNILFSQDSRNWNPPGVLHGRLWGRVTPR